jgi:hypothetical protein
MTKKRREIESQVPEMDEEQTRRKYTAGVCIHDPNAA